MRPVTDFERATSYCPRKAAPRGCPLYLAWRILDEARDYFRTPIPEAFADKLARRAEAVFAHHPFWACKFQSARGREAILTGMRHWLAGVLARERPALFRDLPESFKVGHPLPDHSLTRLGLRGHPLPSDGRGTPPHPGPAPQSGEGELSSAFCPRLRTPCRLKASAKTV
jgi:hypothetical protein